MADPFSEPKLLVISRRPHERLCAMALDQSPEGIRCCLCSEPFCPYRPLVLHLENDAGDLSQIMGSIDPRQVEHSQHDRHQLAVTYYRGRPQWAGLLMHDGGQTMRVTSGMHAGEEGGVLVSCGDFHQGPGWPTCALCGGSNCAFGRVITDALGPLRYAAGRMAGSDPRELARRLLEEPLGDGRTGDLETRTLPGPSAGSGLDLMTGLRVIHLIDGLPFFDQNVWRQGPAGQTCSWCGPRPCPHDRLPW